MNSALNWVLVGPAEEVQAAVIAQNGVGLLHHGLDRREADDVVIAGTAGEIPQGS